ncbi:General stress protein, Gls24 family [Enterococcus sp. HSIEG1]|nr:General stress protein, Gls24 family [Enterococcus sp. HSIEG1]MCI1136290.1 Asp23/Gls24 family envelope stress response protein [Enterococcus gallinarum]MCU7700504.1 Asp23/Gls24 family envelope stress response protein [Enterococcus gallinarum]
MENEQAANVETASLTFEEKVLQTIVGVALASIDGLISADGKFFQV